jgi:hypothetical protein
VVVLVLVAAAVVQEVPVLAEAVEEMMETMEVEVVVVVVSLGYFSVPLPPVARFCTVVFVVSVTTSGLCFSPLIACMYLYVRAMYLYAPRSPYEI